MKLTLLVIPLSDNTSGHWKVRAFYQTGSLLWTKSTLFRDTIHVTSLWYLISLFRINRVEPVHSVGMYGKATLGAYPKHVCPLQTPRLKWQSLCPRMLRPTTNQNHGLFIEWLFHNHHSWSEHVHSCQVAYPRYKVGQDAIWHLLTGNEAFLGLLNIETAFVVLC